MSTKIFTLDKIDAGKDSGMLRTNPVKIVSEGLKRELGIADVAINVVNITIGSGIFLMPAIIAGILGDASILAYIICGFMYLLVALCFAEASSRIATSGGASIKSK